MPVLNRLLLELLQSLQPADWDKQTVAGHWKVKDVAAHLLDGNIRSLSMLRDGYAGDTFNPGSGQTLLAFLNTLNADWVKAMKRVSPGMLVLLHAATGDAYCDYYASLDPMGKSPFAVDWAGETESLNRMHIAREYTEKWLHQQQIRHAVGNNELMTRELFYPFISTFMLALPYTYRDVDAPAGTQLRVTVPGDMGGQWNLVRTGGKWRLANVSEGNPTSEIIIDPNIAWQLFSKCIRPEAIRDQVIITGDELLGETALSMVAVMA